MPSRVQLAHGDAWEVHGRLRAGVRELRGIRCMASGLPHPQWNNGDVTAEDADLEGARDFYAALGVPWGVRVPVGIPWSAGRHLFRKRLMGLEAGAFLPSAKVPGLSVRAADAADFETVLRLDATAFDSDPEEGREWLAGQLGVAPVVTALAALDGEPVATGYALRSDGRAGPCLYVAGIGVVPGARRRGVGAAITSWLLERGFAAGAELAHLHPDDEPAARLYARLGFVETPGFDVYVNLFSNQ